MSLCALLGACPAPVLASELACPGLISFLFVGQAQPIRKSVPPRNACRRLVVQPVSGLGLARPSVSRCGPERGTLVGQTWPRASPPGAGRSASTCLWTPGTEMGTGVVSQREGRLLWPEEKSMDVRPAETVAPHCLLPLDVHCEVTGESHARRWLRVASRAAYRRSARFCLQHQHTSLLSCSHNSPVSRPEVRVNGLLWATISGIPQGVTEEASGSCPTDFCPCPERRGAPGRGCSREAPVSPGLIPGAEQGDTLGATPGRTLPFPLWNFLSELGWGITIKMKMIFE